MGVKSKPTFSYAHIQRFFLHIQMGSTVSRYRLGQRQTVTVMARSSFNLPARPAARVCKTRGPRRRAVGTGENGHGVDRPGHQVVQVFLPSSWVYAPGLRVFESPFFSGSLDAPWHRLRSRDSSRKRSDPKSVSQARLHFGSRSRPAPPGPVCSPRRPST